MASTGKLHSAPKIDNSIQGEANDDSCPVILHPLVVINVSDHYTRFTAMRMFPERKPSEDDEVAPRKLTDAKGDPRVVGILLGVQNGRTVEVCHSFELPANNSDAGQIEIDMAFMEGRIQQYRQIFSDYNVVGWYCTGSEVSPEDLRLHTEVFSVLNEAPILLVVDPNACASEEEGGKKEVDPGSSSSDVKLLGNSAGVLTAYQMELRVVNDIPKTILAPVSHRYASEDSERIAVDHIMRHAVPGGGGGTSSTALHLWTLRRSVKMLNNRIELLVAFLEAMASGQIEVDHSLLRSISGVCARLPAMDCVEFSDAYADERHDSLVVTYLTGVTKSLCAMNEAIDMFNRTTERCSTGAGNRRRATFSRA